MGCALIYERTPFCIRESVIANLVMARARPPQSKRWCFTLNNYSDDEVLSVRSFLSSERVVFACFGYEIGETCKTPHLQGYIIFRNPHRRSAISSFIPRAYLVIAKGSSAQCITYCSKSGKIENFGVSPISVSDRGRSGGLKSSDSYRVAFDLARAGRFSDIWEQFPGLWLRYRSAFLCAPADSGLKPADLDYLPGVWITGDKGVGKSRLVRQLVPPSRLYDKNLNKWWCGFRSQPAVVLDDVDPENVRYLSVFFKRWLDRYSFTAEIKNGSLSIRPAFVFITSQYCIEEVFPETRSSEAIARRCTVFHFDSSLEAPFEDLLEKVRQHISDLNPTFFAPPVAVSSDSTPISQSLDAPDADDVCREVDLDVQ